MLLSALLLTMLVPAPAASAMSPVEIKRPPVNKRLSKGVRGWMGIALMQAPDPTKAGLKPERKAVLINFVFPKSAAEKAGVRKGDILLAVEGLEVMTVPAAIKLVARYKVGQRVAVTLWRGGKKLVLTATLGPRPNPQKMVENNWIGKELPGAFAFTDVRSGAEVKLADLRGKPLILEYWQTTCGPCKRAAPALAKLHKRYKAQGLEILSITDESAPMVKAFLATRKSTYAHHTVVLDTHNIVDEKLMLSSVPTFFYVDSKGIVRKIGFGFRSLADLERDLRTALPRQALSTPPRSRTP